MLERHVDKSRTPVVFSFNYFRHAHRAKEIALGDVALIPSTQKPPLKPPQFTNPCAASNSIANEK